MLDFQQKRKLKGFMYHRTTLIVLVVVLILVINSTWSVYQKQRESQKLLDIANKKTEELLNRQKSLEDKIEALKTDKGVEKEIRSKFSVAKENENVMVVLEDNGDASSSATAEKSFWKKIIEYFK